MVSYAIVWEKGKTLDFSEIILVYDIKVGRCSQLNKYMNLYEYQRSRSFTDLGSNLSVSIFITPHFLPGSSVRPSVCPSQNRVRSVTGKPFKVSSRNFMPFVNCCQFMYLVISLLVLRAGCGI